jgi:flagellar basal-body rod modification protein FlgD
MQVSSVTSNRSAASTTDGSSTTTTTAMKKQVLGQEDFLKLLATQFQAQDPMKPMEDTAFIAQMAQFTALDQSSSLLKQMTAMSNSQDITTANSYIGRHVTLDSGKGQTVSGDVTGVDVSSGAPRLIVGDYTYPLSSVLLVEPSTGASNTSTAQTATTGGA